MIWAVVGRPIWRFDQYTLVLIQLSLGLLCLHADRRARESSTQQVCLVSRYKTFFCLFPQKIKILGEIIGSSSIVSENWYMRNRKIEHPSVVPKPLLNNCLYKLGLHVSTCVGRTIIEVIMSRFSSFFVGLVASGLSYTYVSDKLVRPRNRLMLQHFNAEGLKPYHPNVRTSYFLGHQALTLLLYLSIRIHR